jgi:methionyl-tRNA formyltransferase
MSNKSGGERTSLVLVTGHTFGIRAFEGIFSSRAFLSGQLEVPLAIGLDAGRAGATVGYQSLARLAAEQEVPFVSTADGRLTSLAGRIRDARPAYILVIGWSHLVADEVLAIPAAIAAAGGSAGPGPGGPGPVGCIGMHPTRLPDGRGQAPVPWTIIKGYRQTALTVFFLESDADTGPIVAQYDLDVAVRETAASLFYRLAHAHFTAGRDLAEGLAARCVESRVQAEATATRWPRRRPDDGQIRPGMSYAEIDALVRALLGPYPRAFIVADGLPLPIKEVAAADSPRVTAGRPEAWVRYPCADGVAYLLPESARG